MISDQLKKIGIIDPLEIIYNPSYDKLYEDGKVWMKKNDFTIDSGSFALGISKRQFARFLSGETSAKRVHSLAMQMVWLINENKKNIIDENIKKNKSKKVKKISIPIK